ncbi:MAG: glycosyltransferase family 2 protein [Candidatus Aureabacteria bacterium]|nr:glycosyltransferase family 2 protein [Candidatus Auribacterota bacterium]
MSEPFLSVVIPAYNEEARLVPSLEKVTAYLRRQSYSSEVIVVSDGSRDGTAAAAQHWRPPDFPLVVIDRKENKGKGYTVREGVAKARGTFILFSDADLSTPIEEVEKLLPFFQQDYEVVIASRSLKSSEILVRQPWRRELMGKVFNRIVQFLAVPGIIDTQCGFKCFSRKAAAAIFPLCRVDGFAFDVEILYLARKLGLKVKEVPVRWIDSPRSTVSPLRDSARMFREVLSLRISDWRGAYRRRSNQ